MFFPEKPSEEVRKELKSNGFRWASIAACWQSYLNERQKYRIERCHFKVEAESYEAAVAIIKNFCDCDVNNHEEEVEFGPLEILFEHSEKIDPGKNEGRTTIRIYTEDDTPVIDNAPFGTDTSGAAQKTGTIGKENLTPDEFAHRLNEGGLIAGYKVRFIHY